MKNSTGNIQRQDKNTAYINKKNNLVAPNTHRQSTSINYMGNPEGQNDGGYKVTNANPRLTKKQFLSDNEYTGNAGAFQQKPMSYSDIYNATISI